MSSVGEGCKNGRKMQFFFFFLFWRANRWTIANVISDPSLPSLVLIFLGNNEGETVGSGRMKNASWNAEWPTVADAGRGTTLAPEDRCQAVTWGPANYVITSFPLAGPPSPLCPPPRLKLPNISLTWLKTLTHGRLFRDVTLPHHLDDLLF